MSFRFAAASTSTSTGPMTFSHTRVVAVRDLEGDRAAERLSAPEPAREPRLVLLDLHAAAAAVPVLPPREVSVQRGDVDLSPAGSPVTRPVRSGPWDSPAVWSVRRGMCREV